MPYIAICNYTLSTFNKKTMKKTLAILVLALFIGGISAPVIASTGDALTLIELRDDDPKKDDPKKKKAEKSKEATKSSDCTHEKKSSDCTHERKSESSSKCGGEK